jgi:amino acid permease
MNLHTPCETALLSSFETSTPTSTQFTDEDLFIHETPANSSFLGCLQILLNTAVGTGTLQIPACYPTGIGIATLISALCAFLSFMSIHFLIASAKAVRRYDYRGLSDFCFGAQRRWILNTLIIFQQIGSLTIYCLFIGRLVVQWVPANSVIFHSTQFWTFVVMVFVIFPLTFPRQISALQSAAAFAICFVILLIVHSGFWWIKDIGQDKSEDILFFDFSRWQTMITAFSTNIMAFTCHLNVFPCLEQLSDCTVKRAHYLGAATIGCVFLLYELLGLLTYFDKRDILLNGKTLLEYYDTWNPFTIIATSGVVIVLIVSCPIQLWSLRNSINDFFFKGDTMTPLRWITIGGSCSIIGAFLSSTTDNISIFFDLVGGIATPVLILLMPALFYMKSRPDATKGMKYLAWQHIAFWFVGSVACIYQVIATIISGK